MNGGEKVNPRIVYARSPDTVHVYTGRFVYFSGLYDYVNRTPIMRVSIPRIYGPDKVMDHYHVKVTKDIKINMCGAFDGSVVRLPSGLVFNLKNSDNASVEYNQYDFDHNWIVDHSEKVISVYMGTESPKYKFHLKCPYCPYEEDIPYYDQAKAPTVTSVRKPNDYAFETDTDRGIRGAFRAAEDVITYNVWDGDEVSEHKHVHVNLMGDKANLKLGFIDMSGVSYSSIRIDGVKHSWSSYSDEKVPNAWLNKVWKFGDYDSAYVASRPRINNAVVENYSYRCTGCGYVRDCSSGNDKSASDTYSYKYVTVGAYRPDSALPVADYVKVGDRNLYWLKDLGLPEDAYAGLLSSVSNRKLYTNAVSCSWDQGTYSIDHYHLKWPHFVYVVVPSDPYALYVNNRGWSHEKGRAFIPSSNQYGYWGGGGKETGMHNMWWYTVPCHSQQESGYQSNGSEHWKVCTGCGVEFNRAPCTDVDGDNVCDVCGRNMHTHTWGAEYVAKQATCTADGRKEKKCSSCGAIEITSTIPKLGHSYGAEYVKTPATCTTTGQKAHKCTRCNHVEDTSVIVALGHDYQWKWYSEYGVANAYKLMTCTRDNVTKGEKVYNTYTITYITRDIDTGQELERTTKTKTFNQSSRGNELGTAYTYWNGIPYKYISDTEINPVRGTGTVYRNYRKDTYKVSFNGNGGTGSMAQVTYNYGNYYNLPANAFSKIGYSFIGWAKSAAGSVEYTNQQRVRDVAPTSGSNTVTLFAKWKANQYNLTFDSRYGSSVPKRVVTFDSTYGTLPTLEAAGYFYNGWKLQNGIKVVSTTVVKTPSDHTLISAWTENLTRVTFISPNKSVTMDVLVGHKVYPPFTPELGGYEFKHWSTTPNGPAYDFDQGIKDHNQTYHAVFEGNDVHIKFGDEVITKKYPEEFGELPKVPEVPGKKPVGWAYDTEGKYPVQPTDKVPTRDITVYPIYTTTSYTITLPDGKEYEIEYGEAIPQLPTPTKPGSEFKGWQYNGEIVKSGDPYLWEENITLEPIWEDLRFIVVFPDGSTKELDYGDPIGDIPKAPDKPGQEFDKYVDQNGNEVTKDTPVKGDIIIKPVYRDKIITLVLKDGDWSDTIDVTAGKKIYTLPEREKDGYKFIGWSTTDGGKVTTGPFYEGDELYARYQSEKQTIHLDSLDQDIERNTGSSIGNLPKPSKDGHDFLYWEDERGNKVTPDTKVPPGGMNLRPVWKEKPNNGNGEGKGDGSGDGSGSGTGSGSGYGDGSETERIVIRYWSEGVRINTVDLAKGEVLYDPGPPAVKDVVAKKFVYWTDSAGKKYVFGKQVTSDLDLYAVWN